MRFFLLFINMQLSINLWGFGFVCTTSYGSATIITDNKILAFKVDWISNSSNRYYPTIFDPFIETEP